MKATAHVVFPGQEYAGVGVASSRRIFLIDLENIIGGVVTDLRLAKQVWALLGRTVGLCGADQVVIGACHLSAITAGLSRSSSRLLVQSGPDGADLRLLQVMESENLAKRYTEVVLASGDGIFTDAVRALREDGVRVRLVARPESLAGRLRRSADLVHLLPTQLDLALAA